jgi:hypothetical protein
MIVSDRGTYNQATKIAIFIIKGNFLTPTIKKMMKSSTQLSF